MIAPNKLKKGRKRHLLVSALGLVLMVVVAASVTERAGAEWFCNCNLWFGNRWRLPGQDFIQFCDGLPAAGLLSHYVCGYRKRLLPVFLTMESRTWLICFNCRLNKPET